MEMVRDPIIWLYEKSGLNSLYGTGRDAWIIVFTRFCRMFAYGSNSLVFALFFSSLDFTDQQIGIFMTLTLFGDVLLSLLLTLIADRVGRRRILFGGSFLMVLSGTAFAYFENFWILLLAAVVGVISATGGEIGPFRAIEESTLSHLTTPQTRPEVLSWYVMTATLGSSVGTAVAGRFVDNLAKKDGWTLKDAYHSLFWLYTAMGISNMMMITLLSKKCDATQPPEETAEHEILLEDMESDEDAEALPKPIRRSPEAPKKKSLFGQISPETRRIMIKLWALFGLDSLAGGMTPWSLMNYYVDQKFNLQKSTLGNIVAVAYFLSAFSAIFAGPLSHRIGLINTMVWTHLPSSIALAFIPAPQNLPMTVALIFFRAAMNSMDQAPRAAFIAAVVKPEERTAVMGISSMMRTLAQSSGPTITGFLAGGDRFWVAFAIAGCLRCTYDLGVWAMFVNMKLHQHEPKAKGHGESRKDSGFDEETAWNERTR